MGLSSLTRPDLFLPTTTAKNDHIPKTVGLMEASMLHQRMFWLCRSFQMQMLDRLCNPKSIFAVKFSCDRCGLIIIKPCARNGIQCSESRNWCACALTAHAVLISSQGCSAVSQIDAFLHTIRDATAHNGFYRMFLYGVQSKDSQICRNRQWAIKWNTVK